MHRTRIITLALLAGAIGIAGLDVATADAIVTSSERQERVRTTDRRLQRLLDEGIRASPTLQALVDRLNASDVVVYLQCAGAHEPSRVEGRLAFVSAVGGFRYVSVRLAWRAPRHRQLAILAHELQHAVEIAQTPAIVDGPSLARTYLRFGFVSHRADRVNVAFDTNAAVEAGERVLRELDGGW